MWDMKKPKRKKMNMYINNLQFKTLFNIPSSSANDYHLIGTQILNNFMYTCRIFCTSQYHLLRCCLSVLFLISGAFIVALRQFHHLKFGMRPSSLLSKAFLVAVELESILLTNQGNAFQNKLDTFSFDFWCFYPLSRDERERQFYGPLSI